MTFGLWLRRVFTAMIRGLMNLDGTPLPTDVPITGTKGNKINLVELDTIGRLQKCQRKMKRDKILATAGYNPPPKGESVQQLWINHGWKAPREGLKLKSGPEPEIKSTVSPITQSQQRRTR